MFNVVLYQPEIPPNAGNIMRLCANTGCFLHFIRPLGFVMSDYGFRRAKLDYSDMVKVRLHDSFASFMHEMQPMRIFSLSTKGKKCYTQISFHKEDVLLFGPETRGLPNDILAMFPDRVLRLPMSSTSRSLNLANSVAIVVYEAWRQHNFIGGK